jgi:hypothetical protein
MSYLRYTTTGTNPRVVWDDLPNIFPLARTQFGPLANYVGATGHPFGASWAYGVVGPDRANQPAQMPGGYPWTGTRPGATWPPHPFDQDEWQGRPNDWIRAHLINQGWGGPTDWTNLTPLPKAANANHASLETYISTFLTASLSWDAKKNDDTAKYWYAVYYWVRCAVEPLADPPSNTELYAYAPNFIKLSWRAVKLAKPASTLSQTQMRDQAAQNVKSGALAHADETLPFTLPPSSVPHTGTLPPGYTAGDPVQGSTPLPPGFPATASTRNGFDGDVEVHIAT